MLEEVTKLESELPIGGPEIPLQSIRINVLPTVQNEGVKGRINNDPKTKGDT
jgi:hypothetical protein